MESICFREFVLGPGYRHVRFELTRAQYGLLIYTEMIFISVSRRMLWCWMLTGTKVRVAVISSRLGGNNPAELFCRSWLSSCSRASSSRCFLAVEDLPYSTDQSTSSFNGLIRMLPEHVGRISINAVCVFLPL